jgi:hypothetical protein
VQTDRPARVQRASTEGGSASSNVKSGSRWRRRKRAGGWVFELIEYVLIHMLVPLPDIPPE